MALTLTREEIKELVRNELDLDISDNLLAMVSFRMKDEYYDTIEDVINDILIEIEEFKLLGMI